MAHFCIASNCKLSFELDNYFDTYQLNKLFVRVYERYIIKLLFSRFFVVFLCTLIFSVFQEMTKLDSFAMCTFWQTVLIVPLLLPMILFQFLPFIYFGSLLLVLSDLYSSNELIGFKATGISNKQLAKVFFYFSSFILLLFVALSLLYPLTNKFFYRQRSYYGASNMFNALQSNKINYFTKKYEIFFTDIDDNDVLHNVTIIKNNSTTSSGDTGKQIVFSKKVTLGFDDDGGFVARCEDAEIVDVKFRCSCTDDDDTGECSECIRSGDAIKNVTNGDSESTREYDGKGENGGDAGDVMTYKKRKRPDVSDDSGIIFNRYTSHVATMDISLSDMFQIDASKLTLKNTLRQLGIVRLIAFRCDEQYADSENGIDRCDIIRKTEIHGRVVIYWFIILGLTSVCCLLILRQGSRITSRKITITALIVGSYVSLSRAFTLEPSITADVLPIYYLHLLAIILISIVVLVKSDRRY